ncbi:MAG: hypothetical protein ACLQOO_13070 [Terriglobia bacterium]
MKVAAGGPPRGWALSARGRVAAPRRRGPPGRDGKTGAAWRAGRGAGSDRRNRRRLAESKAVLARPAWGVDQSWERGRTVLASSVSVRPHNVVSVSN